MIKSIVQSGKYVTVAGGSPSTTYIQYGSQQPGIGNMRYNPSGNNVEVFDGSSWVVMGASFASVGLTHEAEELLDWAKEKRNKELHVEHLAKSNPTIADAVNTLRQAQEQLDVVLALTKVHE